MSRAGGIDRELFALEACKCHLTAAGNFQFLQGWHDDICQVVSVRPTEKGSSPGSVQAEMVAIHRYLEFALVILRIGQFHLPLVPPADVDFPTTVDFNAVESAEITVRRCHLAGVGEVLSGPETDPTYAHPRDYRSQDNGSHYDSAQ